MASMSGTLGFQYGVHGNAYYYGDGSTYPTPMHSFIGEWSKFTKERTHFFFSYDSPSLLPGWRLTLSSLYMIDPLAYFYGFNGAATLYSDSLSDAHHFALHRRFFVGNVNLQRNMPHHLRLVGGFSFSHYKTGNYDEGEYGGTAANSLYHQYVQQGLIEEAEADGGNVFEARAGLVYDTRNTEAAPDHGTLVELFLDGAISEPGFNYLRLCAYWSNYINLPLNIIPAGNPVLAWRLAYIGKLAGEVPFYMQQTVPMLVSRAVLSEGVGSAKTIRGLYENRILADGVMWGNFELRVKLVKFSLFKQFFYIAVNPFFDACRILQPYRPERHAAFLRVEDIDDAAEQLTTAAGLGIKLAWNENFIVGIEVAHCFDPHMGDNLWFDLGINYAF
jgi:hypothetical protein